MVVFGGGVLFLMSEVPLYRLDMSGMDNICTRIVQINRLPKSPVSTKWAHSSTRKKSPFGKLCGWMELDYAEMCSGSEAGSYLRLIDWCITEL